MYTINNHSKLSIFVNYSYLSLIVISDKIFPTFVLGCVNEIILFIWNIENVGKLLISFCKIIWLLDFMKDFHRLWVLKL